MTENKKSYGLPCFSFPFLPSHHFQFKWLANTRSNTNMKGYDRFPWLLLFLRMPFSSFCVWNGFGLKQKAWHFRAVSAPFSWGHSMLIWYLFWVLPPPQWDCWSSVLRGHWEPWMQVVGQEMQTRSLPLLITCLPHCPIGLHLKHANSKLNLLRISRAQQQNSKSSLRSFWAWGSVKPALPPRLLVITLGERPPCPLLTDIGMHSSGLAWTHEFLFFNVL